MLSRRAQPCKQCTHDGNQTLTPRKGLQRHKSHHVAQGHSALGALSPSLHPHCSLLFLPLPSFTLLQRGSECPSSSRTNNTHFPYSADPSTPSGTVSEGLGKHECRCMLLVPPRTREWNGGHGNPLFHLRTCTPCKSPGWMVRCLPVCVGVLSQRGVQERVRPRAATEPASVERARPFQEKHEGRPSIGLQNHHYPPPVCGVSSFSREGRRPTGYLCVACGTRAQCPHSSNRCPKPLQAAQLSRDPGCWQVSAPSRPHPKGRERGGEAERRNKKPAFSEKRILHPHRNTRFPRREVLKLPRSQHPDFPCSQGFAFPCIFL